MIKANLSTDKIIKLHDMYPDMTVKQLICLMYIADNEGCTVTDIVNDTKFTQSVVSRILRILTRPRFPDDLEMCLIEQKLDPLDTRRRLLYLNEQGNKLLK